jgi:ATP-binding cassette subfamily B protein
LPRHGAGQRFARSTFISVIGERVLADLRQAVFSHLLRLDARYFDTNRIGELTSRLNGDVAMIRGAVGLEPVAGPALDW